MKRAIVSVINDLSTDQRVHKHCLMLVQKGYDVLLIGRETSSSVPLESRTYATYRMKLPFEKGPLFYATYNIGLFYHLLLRKADLFFSNDLDTLLPNFLVSKLRGKKLIYDSHEFFTEVPELTSRPKVQNVWKTIEKLLLPKVKHALTVNRSIADLYKKKYGIEMKVLRNIPRLVAVENQPTKEALGLPTDKKLIILQGSGINMHRGAEESVEAMRYIDNAVLLILGSGDVIPDLKNFVKEYSLENRVIFKGRMPYEQMMAHTHLADLGLSLDKDTNVNYRFSLPNKLFDYIHAGIPVLGSDLVEVKRIIEEYGVGEIAHSFEPEKLAVQMQQMLSSPKLAEWKQNALKARIELNWEKETEVLSNMLDEIDG
ncbi:MAG: glycosyltransferase [Flavobacteriales bacterium]|nr:glycosyltransferase [Flavobacteriales bacterium]